MSDTDTEVIRNLSKLLGDIFDIAIANGSSHEEAIRIVFDCAKQLSD